MLKVRSRHQVRVGVGFAGRPPRQGANRAIIGEPRGLTPPEVSSTRSGREVTLHPQTQRMEGVVDGVELKGEVDDCKERSQKGDGRLNVIENGIHLGMKRKKEEERFARERRALFTSTN